jgi:4-diphosphocytidyl-2-C-methyl-D-erythritol kinase
MKALYDVAAPAKLNLFLHITGRRSDGYHLIQSVFMLIDWCDTLNFEVRADGLVTREDLGYALPADDLTVRAARALQAATKTSLGAHIGVKKSIPAKAGMGGGSSDAASCLLALNRLWGVDLPLSALLEIGLRLGADVPFFLLGRNAWVEGIGEKITPVELPPARFVVLKPDEGLETRAIFTAPDLKRDSQTAILSGFAVSSSAGKFDFGRNDLQPVAQRLCPGVDQALQWLESRGLQGRMTGSGSAVFAQMLHRSDLDCPTGKFQLRQCNNLGVHPLVGWASSDD